MAYTVEDGTIVSEANSYITLVDARAYASDRGLALPTDDTECEQALVRAADYIDGVYASQLQGRTVGAAQELEWPRYQVSVDGRALASDEIPSQIQQAQVQAAISLTAGVELEPAGSSSPIKREKVGSLETEYQTSASQGSMIPRITSVERLMAPLLRGGGKLRTVRA